jgi:predicted ester cyclase
MTFDLRRFGARYTAAWCSQNASAVAAFFSPHGSLTINDVSVEGERAIFRWTLDGHNTGTGGTGAHIRISGFEDWLIGRDGLITESLGHFDAADYERQLAKFE